MALNLKNVEVERLAADVARLTGESKTEAIRVLRLLESQIWAALPKRERGRRLTRREEDRILGYGTDGV